MASARWYQRSEPVFAASLRSYDRLVVLLAGAGPQSLLLLFVRIVLAGIFWRSGRSKLVEGSWLTISDTTRELFGSEYAGVPLSPDLAMIAATTAEHLFPVLLVIGLFTRLSALALLVMTLVIQIFVYPEAWWSVHSLWAALALILIMQGSGIFALDTYAVSRLRG
jgi:putative oxidoreductase